MRARKSQTQWSEIVRAFERSGQSHLEFCSKRGLVVRSFQTWLYRFRRAGHSQSCPSEVALVPVEVTAARAPVMSTKESLPAELVIAVAGVELHISVGTDAGYVASLVMELRSRC